MKFGHIGLKVLNMDKSIEFYENVLSAIVIKDYVYPDMRLVFLEVGGTIIELVGEAGNEERNVGPIDHIAFKVDSLEDKMNLLDKFNIKYSEPRTVGTAMVIFFDGPNNESYEFVSRV
jgi:catechol 2,3-dioxygenase-like lactoylglutathione lyase family enzyme